MVKVLRSGSIANIDWGLSQGTGLTLGELGEFSFSGDRATIREDDLQSESVLAAFPVTLLPTSNGSSTSLLVRLARCWVMLVVISAFRMMSPNQPLFLEIHAGSILQTLEFFYQAALCIAQLLQVFWYLLPRAVIANFH